MGKVVAGSLNLIPVFSLFLFKRDLVLMAPLGGTAVLLLRPRFAYRYIFGNDGHARSQGGHQLAAAKPPLYILLVLLTDSTSNTAVSVYTSLPLVLADSISRLNSTLASDTYIYTWYLPGYPYYFEVYNNAPR